MDLAILKGKWYSNPIILFASLLGPQWRHIGELILVDICSPDKAFKEWVLAYHYWFNAFSFDYNDY